MSDENQSLPPSAAAAFAEMLRAQEAGEDVDLDALCEAHPTISDELREAHRALARVMEVAGTGYSFSAELADAQSIESLHELIERLHAGAATWDVLRRLQERPAPGDRYELVKPIKSGGMGDVIEVFDRDLRRRLALKALRPPAAEEPTATSSRSIGRFLEEAQVTAQLEHPGIVPIHEIGLDAEKQLYFTMRLVRGRDLREVFDLVRKGHGEWTQTRALGVLLRICEAVAFAHTHGVIHRDLKPSNVMVGRFGEVYVMDWGLAHVMGREPQDVPVGSPPPSSMDLVHTDRRDAAEDSPGSPLLTREGDVVGTPAYMAPEQALGRIDEIGPPTDCYAVGAILYQLLTGQVPYSFPAPSASALGTLERVRKGPPAPIDQIAPGQPAELVAICDKAMSRDPSGRYPDMAAMSDDLRAFLEHRVVKAYRTGPIVELRKWVKRNRGIAASLAAAVVVAVVGAFAVAYYERQRVVLQQEKELAVAVERNNNLVRSADIAVAAGLLEEARDLGPIHPAYREARRAWLDRADALRTRAAAYREELDGLLAHATEVPEAEGDRRLQTLRVELAVAVSLLRSNEKIIRDSEAAIANMSDPLERAAAKKWRPMFEMEMERWKEEIPHLEAKVELWQPVAFEEPEQTRLHHTLREVLDRCSALGDEEHGVYQRIARDWELCGSLERRSITEHRALWDEAIASIRDPRQCPKYGGLEIVPQLGLVPLGRNEDTGLWEFWHVLSGEEPEWNAKKRRWHIGWDTGMVLVLLPGGPTKIGAQGDDPNGDHYDPRARVEEAPVETVTLEPFFASKCELTQGQWLRLNGENPSKFESGFRIGGFSVFLVNPVESVSWDACDLTLRRYGLVLPTLAQHEYATRAGSDTPYWGGEDFAAMNGCCNFADIQSGLIPPEIAEKLRELGASIDDRCPVHAPVDSFRPNAFGLHHTVGNVWEWCRDAWYSESDSRDSVRLAHAGLRYCLRDGDGLMVVEEVPLDVGRSAARARELALQRMTERDGVYLPSGPRVVRGGGWRSLPRDLRSSRCHAQDPTATHPDTGVRAARPLER